MSNDVNKVILIGRLGAEPEVKQMANGNPLATINLATSSSYKDNQGQKQEKTQWHRVVFFNKLAEIVGQYLHKGSQVYVEGTMEYRDYEDTQGIKRYVSEVKAREMQMLGGKGDSSLPPAVHQNKISPELKADDIPF